MMRLLGPVKNIEAVAVSGGPDSMAALSFLKNGNHDVVAIYINHGTKYSAEAQRMVCDYCRHLDIPFFNFYIDNGNKPREKSLEEYWRDERYKIFHNTLHGRLIATGHNMNDVAETYIFTSLHGHARTIPYRNKNVVRPFLITPKSLLKRWCDNNKVPYLDDPSNKDIKYPRNRIRHIILPEMLAINPGLFRVLARRVVKEFQDEEENFLSDLQENIMLA